MRQSLFIYVPHFNKYSKNTYFTVKCAVTGFHIFYLHILIDFTAAVCLYTVPVKPIRKNDRNCFLRTVTVISVSIVCFVRICPRRPEHRERTLRQCILPHWNLTTPGISAGRPISRDGSIFNSSACHRHRYGCAVPSEQSPSGLSVARQQKEGKGCAVLFYFQCSQRSFFCPLLYYSTVLLVLSEKFFEFVKYFLFSAI